MNALLLTCLVVLMTGVQSLAGPPPEISLGENHWSGKIVLSQQIEVPVGAQLIIASGSEIVYQNSAATLRVRGKLKVSGTPEMPVTFTGSKKTTGISLVDDSIGTLVDTRFSGFDAAILGEGKDLSIENVLFQECERALSLLRGGTARVTNSSFLRNNVGLSIEMRSSPMITGNTFNANRRYAVFVGNIGRGTLEANSFTENAIAIQLLRNGDVGIRRNLFTHNRTGIRLTQSTGEINIFENSFEKNNVAILGASYAFPKIKNNQLTENQVAVEGRQYFFGRITHNLFHSNRESIRMTRRSFPEVEYNAFSGGELAIFIDYSSYPKVNFNNFDAVGSVVRLGAHQSADWENRAGSSALAFSKGTIENSKIPKRKVEVPIHEELDFTQNWWGSDRMDHGNEGGSFLHLIYDRNDREYTSFPASGDAQFRLDIVNYSPWSRQPNQNAGLERK